MAFCASHGQPMSCAADQAGGARDGTRRHPPVLPGRWASDPCAGRLSCTRSAPEQGMHTSSMCMLCCCALALARSSPGRRHAWPPACLPSEWLCVSGCCRLQHGAMPGLTAPCNRGSRCTSMMGGQHAQVLGCGVREHEASVARLQEERKQLARARKGLLEELAGAAGQPLSAQLPSQVAAPLLCRPASLHAAARLWLLP